MSNKDRKGTLKISEDGTDVREDEAILHKHPREEKMQCIEARYMTHAMHGTVQQIGGVDEVVAFMRGSGGRGSGGLRSIHDVRRPAVSHP